MCRKTNALGVKKIINLNVVSWFLGLVFYISVFNYVLSFELINSFVILLLAIIIFPPSYRLLEKWLKKSYDFILGDIHRLALIISLFIIFNFLNPATQVQDLSTLSPNGEKYIPEAGISENLTKDTIAPDTKTETENSPIYRVVEVVDGDTIKVMIAGEIKTIRLIGVDSPETDHPEKPLECFGKEASLALKELLTGASVYLKSDETQNDLDKYSRLLRYVYRDDDVFVNKWLIENGYAHEFTYKIPYIYQNEFKLAEKNAEKNKIGLWADDACVNSDLQTTKEYKKNCLIKGNISYLDKEKIYHISGCEDYEKTIVNENKGESWFCTEEEAIQSGWRKAENCP